MTVKKRLILEVVFASVALFLIAVFYQHVVAAKYGQFSDLLGRLQNLRVLRATGNIYVPFTTEAFTYPPTAIGFFYPILAIPSKLLSLVWTVASLFALAAAIRVVLSKFQSHSSLVAWRNALCITVACTIFVTPLSECLYWGQVATFLLLLVTWGEFTASDSQSGVVIGLATAFKLYPGIFLLAYILRRQWRRLLWSAGTICSLSIVTFLTWPQSTTWYFTHVVFGGEESSHFQNSGAVINNGSIVSVFERAPFSFSSISVLYEVLLAGAVVTVAALSSHSLWKKGLRLTPLLALLFGGAIASPVAWDHYFSFIPLLFLVPLEVGRRSGLSYWCISVGLLDSLPWWRLRTLQHSSPILSALGWVSQSELCLSGIALLLVFIYFSRSVKSLENPITAEPSTLVP